MESQKELEKTSSKCLTANTSLKKKKSYWSTKCRKLESTEDVTLSTKIKDLKKNFWLSDNTQTILDQHMKIYFAKAV